MIASFKPYPTYKPSGVEWLGDVPVHWSIRRLCTLASIATGDMDTVDKRDDGRYPFFVRSQTVERIDTWSFEGETVLTAGDGVGVGRVFHYIDGKFNCHQRMYKFSDFIDITGSFFFEYLRAILRFEVMQGTAKATVDSLRLPMLRNFVFVLPMPPEQTAIVRLLDYAERRIQRYIRAKQKLIALLKEQKQAIIHQAVTGRIDVRTGQPYPVYKPSGVEWLGDVPDHWSIRRLCTLASIATGDMDTVDKRDDGRYPFFVRSQTVERIDTWSFEGETVLTAGDGVGVGRVFHYINGKFNCHQRMYKFSDFIDITGSFFFEYLRAILRFEVMQGTAKATVDSLRLPMLRNFMFVLPMPTEQTAIVRFLNDRSIAINDGIYRAKREIDLVGEYRTRLIADVVTGKLDVRAAAAALPEVDPLADEDTPGDTLNTGSESDIDELDVILEEAEA